MVGIIPFDQSQLQNEGTAYSMLSFKKQRPIVAKKSCNLMEKDVILITEKSEFLLLTFQEEQEVSEECHKIWKSCQKKGVILSMETLRRYISPFEKFTTSK